MCPSPRVLIWYNPVIQIVVFCNVGTCCDTESDPLRSKGHVVFFQAPSGACCFMACSGELIHPSWFTVMLLEKIIFLFTFGFPLSTWSSVMLTETGRPVQGGFTGLSVTDWGVPQYVISAVFTVEDLYVCSACGQSVRWDLIDEHPVSPSPYGNTVLGWDGCRAAKNSRD